MTVEEYIKNIQLLNYYTEQYDKGTPIISDAEWDELYYACEEFENDTGIHDPKSPISTIQYDVQTSLKKVTHNHPMLSLSKTKDLGVLNVWLIEPSIVMLKMDGLTLSLCYEDGKLISAETRGNGEIGEDVLHNAKVIPSIPKTIPTKERTIVDGEIICTFKDFEEFSSEYQNPRNFASGSIRLIDPNECAKRKLTFVAWDKITGTENLDKKLDILKDLGFVVVPYMLTCRDEGLEAQQEKMKQIAANLSYPIDGLVYKINDYDSYMAKGYDVHDFKGGKAFKFYDQLFETELMDIEWSVAKTGAITPIAIFKPVRIEGSTVQRASMHNLSIMKELLGDNPHEGQKVWVTKCNMIIPQIMKAEK